MCYSMPVSKETLYPSRDGQFKEGVRDAFSRLFDLLDFQVEGQKNIEFLREGAAAVVAFFPHCGHLDAPAVRRAFPRDLRKFLFYPAASDYWFQENLSGKFRSEVSSLFLQRFSLSRDGSGKAIMHGIDRAVELLQTGYSVVVSPEGTRSTLSLSERQLHTGPAELVLRSGVPLVPVRLQGFEELLPKGLLLPKMFDGFQRRSVSVTIGEPMVFDLDTMMGPRSQQRKLITSQLREWFLEM